ncbi:MAG: putative lipoprotein [Labilithrix sp.]|nr:putative lipoprotein [Labilithrix sp.]
MRTVDAGEGRVAARLSFARVSSMFRIRVTPSVLFVCGAVALASAVGLVARAAGPKLMNDDGVPADAEKVGFVVKGERVNGVALLEATKPFKLELAHGPVQGVAPRPERETAVRAILTRELARYPQGFLGKARLRGVVLTDELHEGELAIPSLPNVGGLLLLDVAGSESDLVRGLHHEIFHFADFADDGSISPDPQWDLLNEPGFAYGAGGRTLRAAWASEPLAQDGFLNGGFVSSYATSGVEEDKAETFAFAMARPQQLAAAAAKDPVLQAKRKEILVRIAKLDPDAPRFLGL